MDADSDDDLNFDDIYEEASRADDDGAAGDSAAAPEREAVDLAALTSSADRDVWSQRNRVWRLNAVALPRLSLPGEANDDWVEKYFPHALTDFAGAATVNREALYALKKQVEMLELANFIIAGPRGSGKTAAALALARAYDVPGSVAPPRRKAAPAAAAGKKKKHRGPFVLRLFPADVKLFPELEARIKKFVSAADAGLEGSAVCGNAKFIIFEGLDSCPAMHQQFAFSALGNLDARGCCFIFTVVHEKKLIDKFGKRANTVHLAALPDDEALEVLLGVFVSERVGYELEGVKLIFQHKRAGRGDVGRAISATQRVFAKWHFCSHVNACKEFCPEVFAVKLRLRADAALGRPPDRCSICTLRPPCAHESEAGLAQRGLQRRAELPQRDADSMLCGGFVKTGVCRVFNAHGHCSLHHPRDVHDVWEPPPRCGQCTLVWPCRHCNFTADREALSAMAAAVEAWATRCAGCRDGLGRCARRFEAEHGVDADVEATHAAAAAAGALAAAAAGFVRTSRTTVKADYARRRAAVSAAHAAAVDRVRRLLPDAPQHDADGKVILATVDALRTALEHLLALEPPAPPPAEAKDAPHARGHR